VRRLAVLAALCGFLVSCAGAPPAPSGTPPSPRVETPRRSPADDAALLAAARAGDVQGVRAALARGADVNAGESTMNASALVLAAASGHQEVVEALLAAGADVHRAMSNKGTALHAAAKGGYPAIVERLAAAGADVNVAGGGFPLEPPADATPLCIVRWYYGNARGRFWLEKPKDPALLTRYEDTVRVLIDRGADPKIPCGGGEVLLVTASQNVMVEIVKQLLRGGADPNQGDFSAASPLHAVVNHCYDETPEVVRILLAAGANPAARSRDGKTVSESLLRLWPAGCRGVDRQLAAAGASVPLRATKFGEAAVAGQVGADRLTLVRAYAYALEEGPAEAQHWTVLVLADRELDEARIQDAAWLRAEAAAGRLRALRLELPDAGGRERAVELLGPRGFTRPIAAAKDVVATDTWETDRIFGKVAYQTPDMGLSGPFRARIRLGPFLAPSNASGSLTLAGKKVELKHSCLVERGEGSARVTRVVLTDRSYRAACTAEPARLEAAAAKGEVTALAVTLTNSDGKVRETLCLSGKDKRGPAGKTEWMRELWENRLMRGRLRSASGEGCRFDVYFAAQQ
jgi:ankyrin repeat protein